MEDEGHWRFSEEWSGEGCQVDLCHSEHGSGILTVTTHPSSTPEKSEWQRTEKWLQQRYGETNGVKVNFRILRYEWMVLKFNHVFRQSTVKVMTARAGSGLSHTFDMQLPHCLATPDLKSMVSAGLSAISCSGFDLAGAVRGDTPMRILNIGHGGGSLSLFLSTKIKGAVVDIVEIDPVVFLSSQRMGFPSFPIPPAGQAGYFPPRPMEEEKARLVEKALWKDIDGRLFAYISDAEDFMLKTTNTYDLVFVDAYDGKDVFPSKLWNPQSPFLTSLNKQLHPSHGTVIVNLHSNVDVSSVCRAYKNTLVGCGDGSSNSMSNISGAAFTVTVPQLGYTTLVASKGFSNVSSVLTKDSVLSTLASKCEGLDSLLELPFSSLQHLTSGFGLVD